MKILATDYDNTLKRKKVTKKDLESIARFRQEGNLFGIVTGRSIDMIKTSLRYFDVEYDFIVGINGGIILNDKNEILAHYLIDHDTALNIIDDLLGFDNDFCGFCDGIRYTRLAFKKKPYNYFRALIFGLKATKKKKILRNEKIASFFILNDDHRKVKEIYRHFCDKYDNISVFLNGKDIVDISAKNVSKSNAVAFLADHFAADHVYTIGDSMNDHDMIIKFNGFAVSTAEEEIKEVAQEVFDDFTQLIAYIDQDESDKHRWNTK
ncbi:MAG: HAD-IIB family hydrolase [Erysipelotrichaceae bacterium]|nr:HAD-IIB family hydrolase [Erysipelotrichaceae bacterium]MDD3924410.1 HAD-IIB family hydrolase [Erysipelotrichaceae bacterium]MDD4642870.1 HAD-IIB family hydrolase [Erysipelotrichaceae bacterium]